MCPEHRCDVGLASWNDDAGRMPAGVVRRILDERPQRRRVGRDSRSGHGSAWSAGGDSVRPGHVAHSIPPEPGPGSKALSPEPLLYSPDMNDQATLSAVGSDSRNRTATYIAVILVEALVIAGLYLFSRYFSA